MKALLIRSLPATEKLPARLKVEMEGLKSRTYSCASFEKLSKPRCTIEVARLYLEDNELIFTCSMATGELPSGDKCVVILPANIQ